MRFAIIFTLWTAALLLAAPPDCGSLAKLSLPNTTIASARRVAAEGGLPDSCRVAGSIHPSPDSNIRFEVWMPETGWNGKFQGVGNGGFAGSLSLGQMNTPLKRGYATATTDTGHSGGDAAWALGHKEKLIDYGHRGIHEMTVKAKAIISAYYGQGPKRSYFASCSNGGRQALMEAQRYPEDYDGIICGAPANNFTRILAGFAWNQQALLNNPASKIPPEKAMAIETAALAACDEQDGLKDGLIADGARCRFDLSKMLCSGPETNECLTQPQIDALKKIYSGPMTSKGAPLFPGFVPGAEGGQGGWPGWISGATPERTLQYFFAIQFFRFMAEENPAWEMKSFDVDRDVARVDAKLATILNSTDPNLEPFVKRGGKLILYHGWCDAALTPVNTINYYQQAAAKLGKKKAAGALRLYMMPGVQHCAGGPGPDQIWGNTGTPSDPQHDITKALEAWVENGTAPAAIIASKLEGGKVTRTRPLCPYPQEARYSGSGSIDEAANFRCAAPKK